jgi:hypothetical protein
LHKDATGNSCPRQRGLKAPTPWFKTMFYR